jgi:hypothetical protein
VSIYRDDRRNGKHLVGTRHLPGWPDQVRAFRSYLKALHSIAPADTGNFDRCASETIDHADKLCPKGRYLYRLTLAELIKIDARPSMAAPIKKINRNQR